MKHWRFLLVLVAGLVLMQVSCTNNSQTNTNGGGASASSNANATSVVLANAATPTPTETDVPIKAKFQLIEGPSFSQDIQPIFNDFCVKCHGADRTEANLRLDSYDGVMRGTDYGPIVVPSAPDRSTLMYVIRNPQTPELAMPKDTHKLSPNRILNIQYWIQAGAQNN